MDSYKKGRLHYEGKTKKVYAVAGHPNLAILKNKPDTTAFNNPKYTKLIYGKDIACTTVTSRIFELFKQVGIPVAFRKQLSPTEILVDKIEMLLLECIARRIAVSSGSYSKRCPWEKKEPPRRFHRLVTEYFLKTTKGRLAVCGETLVDGLSEEEDDPIIINPFDETWRLFHPALPQFHPDADLKRTISGNIILQGLKIGSIDIVVRKAFLFLEGLFNIFGYRFSDFKIELGLTKKENWSSGMLLIPIPGELILGIGRLSISNPSVTALIQNRLASAMT